MNPTQSLQRSLLLLALAGLCGAGEACGDRAPERRAQTVPDPAAVTPSPEPSADVTPSLRTNVEAPDYESGPEYVLHGACPFECCRYGKTTMIGGGTLRASPSYYSDSVGRVADGATVETDSGMVIMHPTGLAVIVAEPPAMGENLSAPRVGDTLEILQSVGEGKNRVRWHGLEFDMATGELGRPVTWLQILREPAQSWWLSMTDSASQRSGWMRIGGLRAELNKHQGSAACN